MLVLTEPTSGSPLRSPPRVMIRPSARTVWPAQNRLFGVEPAKPMAGASGLRTKVPLPSSKYKMFDVPGMRTACWMIPAFG